MNSIFSHRLEVRFRDCDPMGHVNNAVYLTYLEQARFFHWRAAGITRGHEGSDLASNAGGPGQVPGVIVARAEIDYRRAAKYGDTLEIRLAVAAVGRTSFTYEYEILDAAGQLVANARTVLVRFDYAAGVPVPITEELKRALAKSVGELENR